MNSRVRLLLLGLAFGISIAAILWVGRSAVSPGEEPLYQGKTLSYWVTRAGRVEEYNGAPEDAVAAIRAIGPNAVPFRLIKTLNDSDWETRGGALTGLGKIRNRPETVVPLIVPYLFNNNSVIQRSAAYALRDLGSEAGFSALLRASNAPNIGDIIYEVREKIRREESK